MQQKDLPPMAQNIQLPSKAKWAHPPKHQLSPNVGSLRTRSSSNEFTEEDDVVKVSSCNETDNNRVHTIETSNESIEEDDVIEATSAATEAESNGFMQCKIMGLTWRTQ
ncbi:hypothetical protein ACFX14_040417 [Malus domestica]